MTPIDVVRILDFTFAYAAVPVHVDELPKATRRMLDAAGFILDADDDLGFLYRRLTDFGHPRASAKRIAATLAEHRLNAKVSDKSFYDYYGLPTAPVGEIDEFPAPVFFEQDGRQVLLDLARQHPVAVTPEELVRQRVVMHLVERLGYPLRSIETEYPLSRRTRSRKRADIVAFIEVDEDDPAVALVIECKEPNDPLGDSVWQQVETYGALLRAAHVAVANGSRVAARFNTAEEGEPPTYKSVSDLPSYAALLDGAKPDPVEHLDGETWIRPEFGGLLHADELGWADDERFLDVERPPELLRALMNLSTMFVCGETHEGGKTPADGFTVDLDRKLIRTSFGNAGYTAHAYAGQYRAFVLRGPAGEASMPCLRTWAFASKAPTGYSNMLAVGLQHVDNTKRNHALQINLDRYLEVGPERTTLWHDGRLALGEGGSISNSKVVAAVEAAEPSLVQDGRIVLGSFPSDDLLRWNADGWPLVGNLLRYCAAREAVRARARAKRRRGQ